MDIHTRIWTHIISHTYCIHAMNILSLTHTSYKAAADSVTLEFGANVGHYLTISCNGWRWFLPDMFKIWLVGLVSLQFCNISRLDTL